MRIGELAKSSGLSRDTIRFYEKEGLIASTPSLSKSNTYRDYPRDLLERLENITLARNAGMSLADISLLFSLMEDQTLETVDIEAFLDDRIQRIKSTIRTSRRFLKTLEDTRKAINN